MNRDARPVPEHWDMEVGPGEPDNVDFGKLLERLRRAAGLSRADAATRVGFSAEYLRLIEAGKRTPALGQMPNLLSAYGAGGGINEASPEGFLDLVVFDPLNGEDVDPTIVLFTSRIREARRSPLGDTPGAGKQQDVDGRPDEQRAVEVGYIVHLLAQADSSTLRAVRVLLEDDAG